MSRKRTNNYQSNLQDSHLSHMILRGRTTTTQNTRSTIKTEKPAKSQKSTQQKKSSRKNDKNQDNDSQEQQQNNLQDANKQQDINFSLTQQNDEEVPNQLIDTQPLSRNQTFQNTNSQSPFINLNIDFSNKKVLQQTPRNPLTKSQNKTPKLSKSDQKSLQAQNKSMIDTALDLKRQECVDYGFNRIKHPKLDMITEDSLRKCLNDYNIKITGNAQYEQEDEFGMTESDKIVKEMIRIANKAEKELTTTARKLEIYWQRWKEKQEQVG
eukprot:403334034